MIITNFYNVAQAKKLTLKVSFWVFILQNVFFFGDITNTICSLVSITVIYIGISYLFRPKMLYYPVSFLMLFGYMLYYFILPPAVTLLESKELINNLKSPFDVYLHSTLLFLSLLAAHILYRKMRVMQKMAKFFRSVYEKVHLFRPLSVNQIFLLGFISLSFLVITTPFRHSGTDNIAIKILEAFSLISYLPYLLFVPKLFPIVGTVTKGHRKLLYIYPITSILIGLAQNHRSEIFFGFANIIFLLFFTYLYGATKSTNKPNLFFYSALGIVLVFFILPRVALSLIAVRDDRSELTTQELIMNTLSAMGNDDKLKKTISLYGKSESWDEEYVDNIFFSRLCNLKYADNSLTMSNKLIETAKENLFQIEVDKSISILPSPVISMMGLHVDKKKALSGSSGDFLLQLFTGDDYIIGGFRVGSILGSSFAMFDWAYLLVIGFLSSLVFVIGDQMVSIKLIPAFDRTKKPKVDVTFSYFLGLKIFAFCFFFTSAAPGVESIAGFFGFFIRGWIELPILLLTLMLLLATKRYRLSPVMVR